MNSDLNTILDLLKKSKEVVILGHTNPDGDAVNSCYALAYALDKLDIKTSVVLEDYSSKYDILHGNKFLYKYDLSNLSFDLIVCLDTGSLDRIGICSQLFESAEVSLCIDHHISNTYFAKYNYIKTDASSTCEIVYDIVFNLIDIDTDIASLLYAGIIFDTGGFRHSSTTPKCLEIAAYLISLKIPFSKIYSDTLLTKTLIESKIFIKAIQKIDTTFNGKIAYTFLTLKEFREANATYNDLEGIVDYLLNLENVEVVVFAYEKLDSCIKISLRSKQINVSNIAQLFKGGGHKLAAGCTIYEPLNTSMQRVIDNVENELKKNEH